MFAIVAINVLLIAAETQIVAYTHSLSTPLAFADLEILFLGIYTFEFFIKIAAARERWAADFWRYKYNRLDASVLALCLVLQGCSTFVGGFDSITALRVLRGLKSLRVFRSLSFIRSLQVVVEALLNTLQNNVLDIVVLLLLIMFIFGVLGHYLFGSGEHSGSDWNRLDSAIRTLFIYVCADGWLPYHEHLKADGFPGSEVFTGFFIFVGNFIIANMFIGVICQNIDDATHIEEEDQARKKREARLIKRELFMRRQQKDIADLLAQTGKGKENNFQKIVKEMVGTLRHEDVVPVTHVHCNATWLETFSVTLTHRENTLYRIQQLHFGIAHCLAEYLDQRLNSRMKQEQ
ncbi:Ion transport protein-domain-containing protein [Chytriomyces sp. MP71]|nr:Ion transport protein-domain-containing protein [Chytriomyces sp. MP71]